MPILTLSHSSETQTLECRTDQILGQLILENNLPFEQLCAGRGICGKCKVIVEGAAAPLDEIEQKHLLPAERAANVRLACRARLVGDVRVTLMPVVVYSNKIFARSNVFRTNDDPLGLAIDLGSTTVAAFLVSLKTCEVYAGGAALNQQTIFGADVIGPETPPLCGGEFRSQGCRGRQAPASRVGPKTPPDATEQSEVISMSPRPIRNR